MKKLFLLIFAPIALFTTLTAQITQKEADSIVKQRLNGDTKPHTVYAKNDVQSEGYTVITTLNEALELEYSCWVYFVDYDGETNGKYLIVKASNGNLLEINTKKDNGPNDLNKWRFVLINPPCYCIMDTLRGEWSWIKRWGGLWGETIDNEFKSIVRILRQNEDKSINYEVLVEDTLFSKGSFYIQPSWFWHQRADVVINLPHYANYQNLWTFSFRDCPWNEELNENGLMFWDGGEDGYYYHYKKIKQE